MRSVDDSEPLFLSSGTKTGVICGSLFGDTRLIWIWLRNSGDGKGSGMRSGDVNGSCDECLFKKWWDWDVLLLLWLVPHTNKQTNDVWLRWEMNDCYFLSTTFHPLNHIHIFFNNFHHHSVFLLLVCLFVLFWTMEGHIT